jgi:hypothetical protein
MQRETVMLMPCQIEELIQLVGSLDREGLMRQFDQYQANFPLDFTPDFLETAPLERLKHIFVAVCLQSQRMPEEVASEAA